MEDNILMFTDEEGNEIELEVIDSFEMNESKYVVVVTPEGDDEEEIDEFYIWRIESESDDKNVYVSIDDEQELELAINKFAERCEDNFDIVD